MPERSESGTQPFVQANEGSMVPPVMGVGSQASGSQSSSTTAMSEAGAPGAGVVNRRRKA